LLALTGIDPPGGVTEVVPSEANISFSPCPGLRDTIPVAVPHTPDDMARNGSQDSTELMKPPYPCSVASSDVGALEVEISNPMLTDVGLRPGWTTTSSKSISIPFLVSVCSVLPSIVTVGALPVKTGMGRLLAPGGTATGAASAPHEAPAASKAAPAWLMRRVELTFMRHCPCGSSS
jgi:hypothetical protein